MHTYASIYLHVIFATWNRRAVLSPSIRSSLQPYLAMTARNLGLSDVHVGGHDDHVHLLARFDPANAPSVVIGRMKQAAGSWLKDEHVQRFRWQRGFGAFSVSRDRVTAVRRYIARQEEHHRRRTFNEELEALLREHGMSLDALHLL